MILLLQLIGIIVVGGFIIALFGALFLTGIRLLFDYITGTFDELDEEDND